MSICISRDGEYSDHVLTNPADTLYCQRCFVFEDKAAMDRITTLTAERDMALRMHQVQLERANRLESELDRMAGALADMIHEVSDTPERPEVESEDGVA